MRLGVNKTIKNRTSKMCGCSFELLEDVQICFVRLDFPPNFLRLATLSAWAGASCILYCLPGFVGCLKEFCQARCWAHEIWCGVCLSWGLDCPVFYRFPLSTNKADVGKCWLNCFFFSKWSEKKKHPLERAMFVSRILFRPAITSCYLVTRQ